MLIWIALIIGPLLFGLYAQMKISSAYGKNIQIPSRGRITGREAAAAVMESAGIHDVEIVEVEGQLSDHFDPIKKRLALSEQNYHGSSLAAVGVAAHEAGHAIQQKVGYSMMKFRQTLVPAVQVASPIAWGVMSFGILLASLLGAKALGIIMLQLGVVALIVIALFQLVTLPVEFDASFGKALPVLLRGRYLGAGDMLAARHVLKAAAYTYVAAALASLLDVARWFRILRF